MRTQARNMIARALIEYGLLCGITSYTAVCHVGLLQQVLAAGWSCTPLGMPQTIGADLAGAFRIDVCSDSLALMRESWRCAGPVLRPAATLPALAA